MNNSVLHPKVSVITICYNLENTIEKTILSVINQTYQNMEYIVIDGKSKDNTNNIIKKYLSKIDVYISEDDAGIYDAMNKGIKKATGDYIIFINGGDNFYDETVLEDVFSKSINKDIDIITGNVCYEDGQIFYGSYNWCIFIRNTLHHQGTFYRRRLLSLKSYNTDFSILADYDFNLYCYVSKKKCLIIDRCISMCAVGGVSQKINIKKTRQESKVKSQYVNGIVKGILEIVTFSKFIIRKLFG